MGERQPAGGDEATGRVGRQGRLVRATRAAPRRHGGEGALGHGVVGPPGQGKPGPQTVIAARVVETDSDPNEVLAGMQLDIGHDHDRTLARPPAVDDARRPGEVLDRPDGSPDRSALRPAGARPARDAVPPSRRRAGSSCRCPPRRRRRPAGRARPRRYHPRPDCERAVVGIDLDRTSEFSSQVRPPRTASAPSSAGRKAAHPYPGTPRTRAATRCDGRRSTRTRSGSRRWAPAWAQASAITDAMPGRRAAAGVGDDDDLQRPSAGMDLGVDAAAGRRASRRRSALRGGGRSRPPCRCAPRRPAGVRARTWVSGTGSAPASTTSTVASTGAGPGLITIGPARGGGEFGQGQGLVDRPRRPGWSPCRSG